MKALRVKVCGMKDAANVREICREAPDYLGFIFVKDSLRYVNPEEASELVKGVSPEVKTVGVFRNEPQSSIVECVHRTKLFAVQLHGDEDAHYIADIKRALPALSIFKAIQVSSETESLAAIQPVPGTDLFIFDSGRGGTGSKFDWKLLESYRASTPFLLAGGVGKDDIREVRQMTERIPQLHGVDINSRVEVCAGVKDPALVRQSIREARAV